MAVYRSFPDSRIVRRLNEGYRLPAKVRSTTVGLLFILLCGLFTACEPTTAVTVEPDQVTLQLNWVHAPEFAGYYVADAKGFYAEENLKVEFQERDPDSDVPPRQRLVDGDADFAVLGMSRVQSLIEEGAHPVVLTAVFQISPNVFFALQESKIRHPRDLVGEKVGIKSGSWQKRVHATLKQVGIDPSEIVEVEVDFDAMNLLYDGTVDVWTGFVNDEVVNARQDGYDVDLIFPADYAVDTYIGLITQLKDDLESDPVLAERFVRASLRGWEYAIQNPDEAANIIAAWDDEHDIGFHRAAIHELVPLIDTGQVPIGWIDAERWAREMGEYANKEQPHFNMEGLLSIPANRAWFSAVEE